jgi:hypothetical protein
MIIVKHLDGRDYPVKVSTRSSGKELLAAFFKL